MLSDWTVKNLLIGILKVSSNSVFSQITEYDASMHMWITEQSDSSYSYLQAGSNPDLAKIDFGKSQFVFINSSVSLFVSRSNKTSLNLHNKYHSLMERKSFRLANVNFISQSTMCFIRSSFNSFQFSVSWYHFVCKWNNTYCIWHFTVYFFQNIFWNIQNHNYRRSARW